MEKPGRTTTIHIFAVVTHPNRQNLFYPLLLAAGVLAWLFIKWPHLSLPFYWDEAWSYAPAIKAMTDGELGLLPGAIAPELYKGHPMLFFFMAASWLRVFDFSLFTAHAYAMVISLGTLASIFLVTRKMFDQATATLATLAFMASGVFIAQSSMLLPEMQLAMFSLLAVYFYMDGKLGWFAFFGAAAILTKESGIVMIGAVGLYHIIYLLRQQKATSWNRGWGQLLVLAIPLLLYGGFLLVQHQVHGWWFYPDHVRLMDPSLGQMLQNIGRYLDFIFWFNGRHFFYFVGTVAGFVMLWKRRFTPFEKRVFGFLAIFLPAFLVFSSFNFETKRYFLSVLIFLVIIAAAGIVKTLQPKLLFKSTAIVLLPAIVGLLTFTKRTSGDINPFHVQTIRMHEQALNYLQQQQWHDRKISTTFLLEYYAEHPVCGYTTAPFTQVDGWYHPNAQVYLVSDIELSGEWKQFRKDHPGWLRKRWEAGNGSWVEVYVVDGP